MMKLRRMLLRNKLLFLRNFIFVMLAVLLFSSVVVSVYQHQIQQMILNDIELLNLSALEQNMQTLDSVMLGLRELTYTVSQGTEMNVFLTAIRG